MSRKSFAECGFTSLRDAITALGDVRATGDRLKELDAVYAKLETAYEYLLQAETVGMKGTYSWKRAG